MSDYVLKVSEEIPESPARTRPAERPPLRLGLVQQRWHPDALVFEQMLTEGIVMAAEHGARIVCLQELTLSPYFAITPDGAEALEIAPEPLEDGQTITFARAAAALRAKLIVGPCSSGSGATPSASGPSGVIAK